MKRPDSREHVVVALPRSTFHRLESSPHLIIALTRWSSAMVPVNKADSRDRQGSCFWKRPLIDLIIQGGGMGDEVVSLHERGYR